MNIKKMKYILLSFLVISVFFESCRPAGNESNDPGEITNKLDSQDIQQGKFNNEEDILIFKEKYKARVDNTKTQVFELKRKIGTITLEKLRSDLRKQIATIENKIKELGKKIEKLEDQPGKINQLKIEIDSILNELDDAIYQIEEEIQK